MGRAYRKDPNKVRRRAYPDDRKGSSTHLVCPVSTSGEQCGFAHRHQVSGRAAAEAKAQSLVVPEGRIFLKDQGKWEEILY